MIAFLFLWVVRAEAKPIPVITEFTAAQVQVIGAALEEPAAPAEPGDWDFRRFAFRLIAKAGFDVEAAKVELVPELELTWEKSPPASK